jgi:hypothetical protein
MAILDIYLDIDNEYLNLIKDLYKVLVILIVFQLLVYYSNASKNIVNSALTGFLLNDDFMTLLIFIVIGICSYYLVFDKLVSFN